jgi:adenine-specific DNA methylase
MSLSSSDLKGRLKEYLFNVDIKDCIGLTLTLKQQIQNQKLDRISSSQNLHHFLNLLNSKCYGNGFKRYGKRLKVIPVLENSKNNRLHYHLTIQNPFPNDLTRFIYLINSCWMKTKFGHSHTHIHENIDKGWIDYKTKFRNEKDEVDWLNCCL